VEFRHYRGLAVVGISIRRRQLVARRIRDKSNPWSSSLTANSHRPTRRAVELRHVGRAVGVNLPSVVDALSPLGVGGQPAGGVLEAALRLADARTAVPAVDADVSGPIAEVVATTAVGVRLARVTETHANRQPTPRVPSEHDTTTHDTLSDKAGIPRRRHRHRHGHGHRHPREEIARIGRKDI